MARRENGVIINADASQVYADLRILTARPTAEEEQLAPHRLYGMIDGATAWSATSWAEAAKLAIAEAHLVGKLPILVGGSGLYLRTLLEGIAPVPKIDPDIREAVRSMTVTQAYTALTSEDPLMSARLAPSDRQRLCRALEVVRSSGRSLSLWQQELSGGITDFVTLRPFVIEVERDVLYRRCNNRLDDMIAMGALAEVSTLAERKLSPSLPVMKALGIPQFGAALLGEITMTDALDLAKATTRQYAKRQVTWFRNQAANWPRVT